METFFTDVVPALVMTQLICMYQYHNVVHELHIKLVDKDQIWDFRTTGPSSHNRIGDNMSVWLLLKIRLNKLIETFFIASGGLNKAVLTIQHVS